LKIFMCGKKATLENEPGRRRRSSRPCPHGGLVPS
jgi:hypothetical protein